MLLKGNLTVIFPQSESGVGFRPREKDLRQVVRDYKKYSWEYRIIKEMNKFELHLEKSTWSFYFELNYLLSWIFFNIVLVLVISDLELGTRSRLGILHVSAPKPFSQNVSIFNGRAMAAIFVILGNG